MARLRTLVGHAGSTITLETKFYNSGVLFNPSSISSVTIYDAESGGSLISTLTAPIQQSTGIYQTSWAVPVGQITGIYYERWVWTATTGMSTKTSIYSFRVQGSLVKDIFPKSAGAIFLREKELNFFNKINKELIQRIIAQKIIYYSVSEEHTNVDKLYNEAISKTVYMPVELNALINFNEPQETTTNWSIDTKYSISVYIHEYELKERNIEPREGDFVNWHKIFYEIKTVTRPQILFGQIENTIMAKLECVVSRQSNFNILDEEE